MTLGLPSVNIQFIQEGMTAIKRGSRGVVALILKESTSISPITITSVTDIPSEINAKNKQLITNALIGNTNSPLKVELFVISGDVTIDKALEYFDNTYFDYLAYPEASEAEKTSIVTAIKAMRDEGLMRKAVLSVNDADYEGIINVTQSGVVVGDTTYTAGEFTARVAGLIAGTDLRISTTYANLPEVDSIPYERREATETKVGNGEFVLMKESGKIKVARGITSLTTTTDGKGELFQKIKTCDIMDLIANDIKATARDSYLGKYSNNYDNKCLLISAIRGYLEKLVIDGLVERNSISVDIDMDSQRAYLKGIGVNLTDLSDQEIKEYNTGDKVFISVSCKILDAIEEISIRVFV